ALAGEGDGAVAGTAQREGDRRRLDLWHDVDRVRINAGVRIPGLHQKRVCAGPGQRHGGDVAQVVGAEEHQAGGAEKLPDRGARVTRGNNVEIDAVAGIGVEAVQVGFRRRI